MDNTLVNTIRQRAERERTREHYPEGFPALPVVPAVRYSDPHFFALEREHVFDKSWLYVAHASELPNSGDTALLNQFTAPLFLIRGRDNHVRCFYNACRHRGAPLVNAGEPAIKGWLVCKYHSWAYHLDGQLAAIPEEYNFKGADKACIGLHAVQCETWADMVFINLDPHARPLREYLAPIVREIDDEIGDQAPGQTYLLKKVSIDVAANWKLVAEAQLEAYHVNTIHQNSAGRFLEQRAATPTLLVGGHSRFFTRHHPGVEFRYPGPHFPRLNDLTKHGALSYAAFPNLVTVIGPNLISTMTFWPSSPSMTRYDMHYIGAEPFDDNEHAALGRQIDLNTTIFREDLGNLPSMQASIAAGAIPHVRFGYQECRLYHLHEEIDRRIGLSMIPEPLRVTQVLDGWVER